MVSAGMFQRREGILWGEVIWGHFTRAKGDAQNFKSLQRNKEVMDSHRREYMSQKSEAAKNKMCVWKGNKFTNEG